MALVLATGLLALTNAPAGAEKPLELVLNPAAGKALHYSLDNQTEVNYQGRTMSTTSSGTLTLTRGADAANKNLVFDIVIEKIEMSRRQGNDLQSQDLGLDGAKLKAEVTSRGKVVKVEPVTTLSQQQATMAENLVDVLFVDLPDKPVKSGDTWTVDLSERDGSATGSGEFTLDEVGKKDGRPTAMISGPVRIEVAEQKITGKGSFEATVAVQGGYAITAKGSIDLKGDGPSVQQSFELKLAE
jgi:hypothetical protein